MEEYLGKKVDCIIDRPLGSKHPKFNHYYPINYGYIPNTVSGDGMEIDVYIIGEEEKLDVFTGYVVAYVKRYDDVEDKLVVCKDKSKYSKEDIEKFVNFQEQYFISEVII